MTYTQRVRTTLSCDLCPQSLAWNSHLPRTLAERYARQESGWRKDKLGRNVCPAHPKLKGARRDS